jgi:hypothetical protein
LVCAFVAILHLRPHLLQEAVGEETTAAKKLAEINTLLSYV